MTIFKQGWPDSVYPDNVYWLQSILTSTSDSVYTFNVHTFNAYTFPKYKSFQPPRNVSSLGILQFNMYIVFFISTYLHFYISLLIFCHLYRKTLIPPIDVITSSTYASEKRANSQPDKKLQLYAIVSSGCIRSADFIVIFANFVPQSPSVQYSRFSPSSRPCC